MSEADESRPEESSKTTVATSGPQEWPEVRKVFESKRYELCLVGPEISKRIEDANGALDSHIFKAKHLNFLEIAKTKLSSLPSQIESLENLTSLLCHTNQLTSLPAEIGKLVHLKNLDFSNNKLTKLPDEFKNLKELHTINFCGNELTELFPLGELSKLAVLDISRNKFTKLPDDLGSASLENLSQVNASLNQLNELSDQLAELPSLKLLNLEHNQLTHIPANLCKCIKLKDLLMKENKLKDNRLKKLVEQDKGKAIIDYLERVYVEECKTKPKPKAAQPTATAAKKKAKATEDVVVEYDLVKVLHYSYAQGHKIYGNEIVIEESVAEVRPFIVCCILRDLDLETPGHFKKFLTIQTKIQDETCEKRTNGTIATHDLEKLKSNLVYEAKDPDEIELVPLGRKNPLTALEFYEKLVEEAEAERKAKKRNQLSGIYKYLSLLENQSKFPYVRDQANRVISLPPLTNSEDTKMSTTSKNILIEITSSKSLDFCKKVMEELMVEMLNAGIASNASEDLTKKVEALSVNSDKTENEINVASAETNKNDEQPDPNRKLRRTLLIQQVRINDSKGSLKLVYPSRIDLTFGDSNKIQVNRLYDE